MRRRRVTQPDHAPIPVAPPSRAADTAAARVVRSMQRSRRERRVIYLLVGAVLGAWLFMVFANALADADEQRDRLAQEAAENARLAAMVDAGVAELVTIGEPPFLQLLARGYRIGDPVERPFALAPGAPPPPEMRPLGQPRERASAPSTPAEDWVELLIGS